MNETKTKNLEEFYDKCKNANLQFIDKRVDAEIDYFDKVIGYIKEYVQSNLRPKKVDVVIPFGDKDVAMCYPINYTDKKDPESEYGYYLAFVGGKAVFITVDDYMGETRYRFLDKFSPDELKELVTAICDTPIE